MKTIKAESLFGHIFLLLAVTTSIYSAQAQTVQTNLAVTVRHAPNLNGGTIQGSLQQLNGESVTANGGFSMTGDLLVPGTPTLLLNGNPTYSGTIAGSGSTSPSGYQLTLNGNCSLHYLRTRTTPVSLPTVSAPPSPTGTRSVTINSTRQSYGDATTLRDLTLNGNVGMIAVPPGTYGNFTVNGGSGLVLGVAGGFQAVNYNLQNMNLNGNSTLKIVGPVVLTVKNGFTANGTVGSSNNPTWLQLKVASGGFTLNGGCIVYGLALAPNGTVIINGNSTLVGTSASDQFILNGGGLVRWGGSAMQTNQPPTATAQTIMLAENSSTNITLTGTDPQGGTLSFTLLTMPAHGTVSGTPPSVTYKPATNYFGSDAFTFKVNNGFMDSSPATISLTVTQVYYAPTAIAQSLTNFEDTALPVTLTGYDPQGYALTFSVLTQPAHGTLSGTVPNLTYQPATNYFGNDSFTFRVNDGVSNSLAATISITNKPVDDAPVVVAGANQLIILPTNFVYFAGFVTYDSFPGTVDTVVWSKVSGPGSVTFSSPSNILTTATFSTNGIYRLRLFASDSFLSGSNDLFVTVDAPPVVGAGSSMTNTFPGTITLAGSASDDGLPTNGALTVAWSKVSGPGTVVFGNATTTNSAATFSTNGIYVLRLTADDSIVTNHSDVTVIENLPPIVNAGTSILTNGLHVVLNGIVTDDGLPGAFLSVQWSQSTGPGTVVFGNASATNTTVTASQSGTYILLLTAFDGAATNSGELTITFNLPPVVNAGSTQTVNFGTTVTLAGTVTDDQLPHNILNSTWSEVSGPGDATFADASLTNTTVTFDQPGIYTLRLTASDTLATTNADVVIQVNAAPVVNAGTNQFVTLGTLVTLAGSYTDDGIPGSTVTTLWTQTSGPAGAVFTDPTSASTTVSLSQSGVYVFQLTADDGLTNGSAQVTVTVNQPPVIPPNNPPTVSIITPVDGSQFQFGQVISLEAAAVDSDGLVTNLAILADGVEVANLTVSPYITNWSGAAVGRHVLSAVATDNHGATSVSSGVAIWVVDESGDFTVDAGSDQIISLPDPATLAGNVEIPTPVEGSQTNIVWAKLDGPGSVQFSTPNTLTTTAMFSEPGTYTIKLQIEYNGQGRSDVLKVDVLPAPPNRLTAARSSQGTDFWLTFLNNQQPYYEVYHNGRELIISATADTVGTINFNTQFGIQTHYFQVKAGSVTTYSFDLGSDLPIDVSDSTQDNAIHVTADHPVTVYGLNYEDFTTDGYLGLPTAMLGTDYIILTYRNSPSFYDPTNDDPANVVGGTQFAVVASENNTSITIVPSVTTDSRIAGVPYQIVLQQGQTYRLINNDGPDADMTGTTIKADKPVAVFGGVKIALVPASTAAGDHLVEELPPVNMWGSHFVTMPLATRTKGDTFRFLAATNDTRISINGKIVASLSRGQFYEQIIDDPAEIFSSKPILVAQYANGSEYDGSTGDPFMMLIPPFEQFGGDYTLSTPHITDYRQYPAVELFSNYLNLVVRSNGVGTILLDGYPVPANCFLPVANGSYAGAQLPVNSGTHHLTAPVPFEACIYGWADYESYGFMGGVYTETIESDTRLELTQTTPFAVVNHEKTVTARITNGRSLPIPDIEVSFSVSGANTATGHVIASHFGEAIFSYVGANAGADVITATLVDLTQSVTNTWIATSGNHPPVASTAGTEPFQYGHTVQLVGTVTDDNLPVGAPLNVQWRLLAGPAPVQFENETQSVTTAVCSQSGAYEFELVADDTQFSTHSLVNVMVDDRPNIGFANGYTGLPAIAPVGSPITLMADASDDDGIIDRVEYYANDVLIGTATNWDWWSGYSFEWTPVTNGLFQFRAVAFDNVGGSNSLEMGSVQMGFPPQVTIDNPGNNAVLTVPTNVFVHASASDSDGLVTSISLYANGELLATSSGSEVSTTWFPRREGTYTLTAVVTDDLGLTTTSAGIATTVTGDFPLVSIIHNATNRFGDSYLSIPINVATNIVAEVAMAGPYRVTNVTFYIDDTQISVQELPYQISWTADQNWFYLTVVAEADSGAIGEVQEFINPQRDISIAFASPDANHPVVAGSFVPIGLSVFDPGHLLAIFDYYVDGQLLVETTNSDPVLWQPSTPGTYQLSVQAYDRIYGRSAMPITASTSVTAVAPPIENVSIVSPADGDTIYAGANTPISVGFDDATGAFDHLEIFTNGVSLGQTTNTVFNWVPFQTNDYVLTARVFDHDGYAYDSTNNVMVHTVTAPRPVVTITSPVEGSRVRANAETVVIADLNDPAGITTNVQFYVDGLKVSDNTTYFSWTPIQIGSHGLQAVALTSDGDSISSVSVNVTVVVMYSPVVTLLSPANEERFPSDIQPLVRAQATDSDGSITNLTLTLDSTVLGNTNGAELEALVANVTPGWHTASAQATDNDGLSGSSDMVRFYVDRRENLTLPMPEQFSAQSLSATEIQLSWQPVATNELTRSILVERWDAVQPLWSEIGETAVGNTNYTDSALNPETNYRYRIACLDTNGIRSSYSAEANATTRTVAPNFAVIDLTAAIAGTLTNLAAGGNILTNGELTDFDIRRTVPTGSSHVTAVLGTNTAPLSLAVAHFKEQWPQIQLDYDPVLLSPKSILPRLGFLTDPGGSGVTVSDATAQMFDPNDPYRPVKAFLQEYQVLFEFGPEAITNATVQRDYVSPVTGARTVVWQQQVGGIPVFNALFTSHITATGELAGIASEFIPAPAQAADPAMVAAVLAGGEFPVSSAQALLTAVNNAGDLFAFSDFSNQTDPAGVIRSQSFSATKGIKDDAHAELTWFPSSRNELKLAWQVIFTSQWRNEMYLTVVSALDNQILYRRNLTADSSDASYRVYLDRSPAPMSPGLPAPGNTQAPTIDRSLVTLAALDPTASPNGWINDGDNETRGNNVDAHLDRNDDNVSDVPRPTGNPWRVFDCTLDLFGSPDNYGNAAVTQLFFWDNWMHDTLYELGFTEPAGNFQNDNFGRGGWGGDAVLADAQDGAAINDGQHHNNANMSTPPDGYAPRMQMYVFDGVTPARDGSLDAEIVLHEYTHGLSSRLIGGGAGIDALQTAGMGEGWSDFYALALLASPTNDADATYPIGAYVTYHGFGTAFDQNYYYGIRRYPYCTDTNKNPLTFADIDPARASAHAGVPRSPLLGAFQAGTASEVHSQGEVWAMMLWEMRASLIHKLGAEPGNNLVLQLVTEGLRLAPPNPNFVQARDAILLADRMVSGGVNAVEIWAAFAKRGLGYNAKCPESYTTTGVQSSYELMPALATELVEVQTASGAVELGVNNYLLIHLRNQGGTAATHITGQLSTTVPGVTVVQGDSTYADIPQGGSQANAVAFQLQTGTGFVEGTPIDLVFVITSDQSTSSNYLRLYTGVPGAEILFDNYSALAVVMAASSAPKDLTPWYLANMEPLWMADDASCLLKASAGLYWLWKPDGTLHPIVNPNFLAHRLTHNGVVVGTLTLPVTFDELNNKITNSVGVRWDFDTKVPVPLTLGEYRWPKNAAPLSPAGAAYSLKNVVAGWPQWLTNVTIYPELQDVWDMNIHGVAAGSVSVQEQFNWQRLLFDTNGIMDWFTPDERGLNAGSGGAAVTELRYFSLLSTAGQFKSPTDWRWLGPLSANTSPAIALLVNDAGMLAGYGGISTGDPAVDALRPTHAFRAPVAGEYDGTGIILNDLGVLTNGLHSFPRAMNADGNMVGYSDFDVSVTGGLNARPENAHAVYWAITNTAPEWLTNYPASSQAPYGYGDAFGINDSNQIVGASMTAGGQPVGVLWQWNHNTNDVSANGAPATTNAPFWEITTLNDRLTDPSWQVFRALDINNDGLILAHAVDAAGAEHAVLLVPMAMAVDNNRDGGITFDAADATSITHPYRFWVNDDQDYLFEHSYTSPFGTDNATSGLDETVPPSRPDYQYDKIQTIRDLEDFARLNIRVQCFIPQILNGTYQIGLKWKHTTGSPAIKLFRNLSPNGDTEYLTDATVAKPFLNLGNPGYVSGTGTYLIPTRFWQLAGLSPTHNTGFTIFEGCAVGKGQLVMTLNKPDGTEIAEAGGVWLELKNIKEMYQRVKATPHDPNGIPAPFDATSTFDETTASTETPGDGFAFSAPTDETHTALVFVHGSNISYDYALENGETLFKRLYWQGYKGRFVLFYWNTLVGPWDGNFPAHYNYNEYRALKYGQALKNYVENSLPSGYAKNVVGHSMGNMVVASALYPRGTTPGMTCQNVILMQAAVPASCFDAGAPIYSDLATLENPQTTPDDFANQWGYRGLTAMNINATIYNIYNAKDYALDKWILNQEFFKPENLGHPIPREVGTHYEWSNIGTGLGTLYYANGFLHRTVIDPQESITFIARSCTAAVGTVATQGSIGNNFDVGENSPTGLGDQRPDHSGEFTRPIQQLYPFYNYLYRHVN